MNTIKEWEKRIRNYQKEIEKKYAINPINEQLNEENEILIKIVRRYVERIIEDNRKNVDDENKKNFNEGNTSTCEYILGEIYKNAELVNFIIQDHKEYIKDKKDKEDFGEPKRIILTYDKFSKS